MNNSSGDENILCLECISVSMWLQCCPIILQDVIIEGNCKEHMGSIKLWENMGGS